jgi:hypothetical protein
VEEPSSLADLRRRTAAMLPRVDLPEVILEVMSWEPGIAAVFTAASGGRSRLEDLGTSIAACLAAHSMNIGYRPIARAGVPALEWSRLSHVYQNYFRPETIGPANAPMVSRRAGIPLAAAWGGGMVAAVPTSARWRAAPGPVDYSILALRGLHLTGVTARSWWAGCHDHRISRSLLVCAADTWRPRLALMEYLADRFGTGASAAGSSVVRQPQATGAGRGQRAGSR